MEKKEFITALSELVKTENVLSVSKEVKDLRNQFEDYTLEASRLRQIAELDAAEKGEEFDEVDWIPALKDEFYELYIPFQEKIKSIVTEKRKIQEQNLYLKKQLINELKTLISEEENIGIAFSKHKEINEKWKSVGEVARDKRHEIQQEYSRLLEDFFYHMRIYKEIKDYDLEKNFDVKKELIERLKGLSEVQSIREVEASVKSLQDEWEDIGPTKTELWEGIKNEYWATINSIYERIRAFYDQRREKRQENLQAKQELIEKVNQILTKDLSSIKEWNSQTKKIIEIQDSWKKIGAAPKEVNDEIWSNFRNLCDQFFDRKSAYFKGLEKEFNKVAEKKQALIEKVNAIKGSRDWQKTTREIISIQKEWKNTGNAGQKNESKLWKEFRGACDEFFNSKDQFYADKDKEFEGNLTDKETLIQEITDFVLPEDKKEAISQLKEFSNRFSAIGFVPSKEKDRIYKAYKNAIYKHYESLDLKAVEREKVLFEARIDTIKGSGNSADLFAKEKQALRQEMNTIKSQILQYENNLGFFANSNKPNPLKDQVQKNIKQEQEKLTILKEKLKMIPNE